jgi:hypothetical protein
VSDWAVLFLGLIALATLTQTAFMVVLALRAQALERRVAALSDRLERDVRPMLEGVTRVAANAAEISDLAVIQMRRIDEVIADVTDRIKDTTAQIQKVVIRPLGPLADIVPFLRGIQRGFEVYHKLRGHERGRRSPAHSYDAEDEHLFI